MLENFIFQLYDSIVCDQMKEIQEKIVHFEALELLLEKEQLQLRRMKDLLFADQLNLLRHKTNKFSKEFSP